MSESATRSGIGGAKKDMHRLDCTIRKENASNGNDECQVTKGLKKNILRRTASLTLAEKAFLSALLIDKPRVVSATDADGETRGHKEMMAQATKVLDDEILFSTPFDSNSENVEESLPARRNIIPPKTKRNQSNHIGLWRAHEDGVTPSTLIRKASSLNANPPVALEEKPASMPLGDAERNEEDVGSIDEDEDESDGGESIRSDEEVRQEHAHAGEDDEDLSSASSWDESKGGFDHYDAWAVLKDEYSKDFGFDFTERGVGEECPGTRFFGSDDDEEDDRGMFKIVGTSADDISAHPHVLSPPLMDSLLNFVPEALACQNFWLKFSLVRDGASLKTLMRYTRAAPHTILAIETTSGDVFGSFTSSPWRANWGYFGNGEAFLWKMRHSRLSPCHSLFEQAQMESEVDVYPFSGLNDYVQLCSTDKIAVGGGQLDTSGNENHGDDTVGAPYVYLEEGEHFGFGLAVSDDLLHGTSSPCATFRNPCLCNHSSKGELFEIVNLEVWTFTPCETVLEAEKLEMTKFFVQESVLSSLSSKGRTEFSSEELVQEDFYRRVGERDESEVQRDGWEYAQMMNPGMASQYSMMRP